jgi:hypothetical protein
MSRDIAAPLRPATGAPDGGHAAARRPCACGVPGCASGAFWARVDEGIRALRRSGFYDRDVQPANGAAPVASVAPRVWAATASDGPFPLAASLHTGDGARQSSADRERPSRNGDA